MNDTAYKALRIAKYARFGNALVQCLNSIRLARELDVPVVIWPVNELFSPPAHATAPVVKHLEANSGPDDRILDDNDGFYYSYRKKPGYGRFESAFVLAALDSHLRPAVNQSCFNTCTAVKPDDLVIHLRSGDIFSCERPNRKYVQPPLSFYLIALEHHLRDHPGAGVHLVFEDRGNPVIDALEAHCQGSDVPVTTHSGTLVSDISVLMSARHLVLSFGTFGPAVALLSKQDIKTVWVQRPYLELALDAIHARGTLVFEVRMTDPDSYIGKLAWTNSPEQRQLMLDFPSSGFETGAFKSR